MSFFIYDITFGEDSSPPLLPKKCFIINTAIQLKLFENTTVEKFIIFLWKTWKSQGILSLASSKHHLES